MGDIKADHWVNPEKPGSDSTAEQETVGLQQPADLAEQPAVEIQQQVMAAEERSEGILEMAALLARRRTESWRVLAEERDA